MPRKKPPANEAAAPLEKYRAKRSFGNTPEPDADVSRREGRSFVVQEHHARSHHFDFRLEMDGVLVSWAVPKGIPQDPAAKRLAVHVEDHPLAYGAFEGIIPQGNYGAGTVAIWDQGEWEPLDRDWRKSFARGKIKFALKGNRLRGVYRLIRMGEEPNWLMRLLEEETATAQAGSPEREQAAFVAPQLARVVPVVPTGGEWLHEIKLDGYRLVAVQRRGSVRLFTRTGLDWTDRFRKMAQRLSKLTPKDFVMDGEAVVFDPKGRSQFGALQAALQENRQERMVFVAFDLMHFDGVNLRTLPLSERLEQLAKLVRDEPGPIRRSTVWQASLGTELFRQACANGLEGMISKRANGRYVPGSRRDWVKSKCRSRQEFVICGFTPPQGSLPAFGALVLASFENGKLIPRGKVGTGFSHADRVRLRETFQRLRSGQAAFPVAEKEVAWLKPQLVAEVEFAELTRDGLIRQGSFVGLREDKAAAEVHLDAFQPAGAGSEETKVSGIVISHPERLVYPDEPVSKAEVARYYETVGELMLPFVAHRPLAVLRAPGGIGGEMFFQKSFPAHVPDHVRQRQLDDGTTVVSISHVKGLISLAQFGVLEFHPWGSLLSNPDRPDFLIWDLDPDAAVPWHEVLGAAFLLRDVLGERGLSTVVKTSGGKGLHILLHLKRVYGWDVMRPFAKAVANAVAAMNPKRFITTSAKAKRAGRIYIDWLRNGKGATCVAPWSLRARPGAAVSMPVSWEQLPDVTADGYRMHMPPEMPAEWAHLQPQVITKRLLKEFHLG